MRGQRQAHSSVAKGDEHARDDWRTPTSVLTRVRQVAELCWPGISDRPGAGIFLDPCSNADGSTGAAYNYSGPDGNGFDGLVESWGDASNDGLVFPNWVYSQSAAWVAKMVAAAADGVPIIGLGPARPDTQWHRTAMTRASALVFWRSRITFELPPGAQIYRLTTDEDPRQACRDLASVPGVLVAKPAKGYIYVEAQRDVLGDALLALGAAEMKPSPAPFPSALYSYNIPRPYMVEAFGDVADVYAPPERLG